MDSARSAPRESRVRMISAYADGCPDAEKRSCISDIAKRKFALARSSHQKLIREYPLRQSHRLLPRRQSFRHRYRPLQHAHPNTDQRAERDAKGCEAQRAVDVVAWGGWFEFRCVWVRRAWFRELSNVTELAGEDKVDRNP